MRHWPEEGEPSQGKSGSALGTGSILVTQPVSSGTLRHKTDSSGVSLWCECRVPRRRPPRRTPPAGRIHTLRASVVTRVDVHRHHQHTAAPLSRYSSLARSLVRVSCTTYMTAMRSYILHHLPPKPPPPLCALAESRRAESVMAKMPSALAPQEEKEAAAREWIIRNSCRVRSRAEPRALIIETRGRRRSADIGSQLRAADGPVAYPLAPQGAHLGGALTFSLNNLLLCAYYVQKIKKV